MGDINMEQDFLQEVEFIGRELLIEEEETQSKVGLGKKEKKVLEEDLQLLTFVWGGLEDSSLVGFEFLFGGDY